MLLSSILHQTAMSEGGRDICAVHFQAFEHNSECLRPPLHCIHSLDITSAPALWGGQLAGQ